MNENLKLDNTGYALLARFEGTRSRAYLDSAGIPTIGIGFIRYTLGARAGQRVKMGDSMSEAEIRAEFLNQVQSYEAAVRQYVRAPLTQSQFNACVSLCYNIGTAAFAKSSAVRLLNEKRYQAACAAFALWNKAGGRVVRGLENRRKEEQKEFFRNG
ncbi:Phage-related lysozyme (muraminidase) [Kingella potus]|uniref:Lysozyme n=1 Tax=Kingella potus TaxID=265175 RepID=A0A377QWT6_9NEIS|nr:lysozyme [Kingella potus]UOP00513.1 lysozyme [Kingella potus]UOP02041.1 lysozyme [Kingella potus]STQ99866.1 Phage-related lysozyme (muraminidase) [Kingella potus]STR02409.1 Phage-related lysozyme (muraminidase) [Kingella potus]